MSPYSRYLLALAGASHPDLEFDPPHLFGDPVAFPDPDGWADQPPTGAQTIGLQAAAGIRFVVRPASEQAWRDIPNAALDSYVAGHADTDDLDAWVATATDDQLAAVWTTAIAAADRWYARRDGHHLALQA